MAVANPDALKPTGKIWFFNPLVDFLCLGGITYFFIWLFDMSNALPIHPPALIKNTAWIPVTTFVGSILVNYPHYAATYYRVYRKSSEVKKYAFEAIWAPLFLIVLGAVALFSPAGFAPWYALAYVITSGYHYSGQTYGISLICTGKSGLRLNAWQKWCIIVPVYACYLYPTIRGNTPDGEQVLFYGIQIPSLNIHPMLAPLMLNIFYAGVAMYVAMNLYFWLVQKKRLPGIVHVVVGAQVIWYSVGSMVPGFFNFVPFFHCLQYLVITSYFDFKEVITGKPEQSLPTPDSYLRSWHFGRYYIIQIVVGSLLFLLMPLLIEGTGLATHALASAVVVSFLNIHHFVLDGAIWKLRKPDVGQTLFS